MFPTKFSVALALLPILTAVNPGLAIAQNSDPYRNWQYLYDDTFRNSAGQEISQEWRLNPQVQRTNALLKFSLLARRTPVGSNGAAAAVFDYVADCNTLDYALEKATQLDSNNGVLGSQTYDSVMDSAEPNTNFYSVLDRLCKGQLPG